MDHQRLFLYAGLAFLGLIIWQQWQLDYALPPQKPEVAQAESDAAPTPPPPAEDVPDTASLPDAPPQDESAPATQAAGAGVVTVQTDRLRVRLSLRGGDVSRVELLSYPVEQKHPDVPLVLMDDSTNSFFVAQSGLQSSTLPAPTHHDQFAAEQTEYQLGSDADVLVVPLHWEQDGVKVTKRYTFRRDSYVIEVEQRVENDTQEVWSGRQYFQLQRKAITDDETSRFIYTFIGGVILDDEGKYTKIDFDEFDELESMSLVNSWVAIIQHYFLAAWVPEREVQNTLYGKSLSGDPKRYILGMFSPIVNVSPGSSETLRVKLFSGPKEQDRLAAAADKLNLTVDYGVLTILSDPLFWLLRKIHEYVGNWGWSIVVVTILIKLVFYKLSELSYKSMARMRKLQPKLQSLKERFGDDRQKLGQATMELYRKEKINPLGGCLPMIVQIPVFIALYWVLLESVELRQAPFVLWITDLSVKDPFFILPLIMGVTMFVQQKLNPTPVDPVQAKIFMLLPFIFTVFFAFFPAGLVLYWAANNLLSIIQQWYITRHVLAEK